MGGLTDELDECETHLRWRLEPDERVVAVGRCEDITLQGDIDASGAGWTFVMVTDRHLRWVPYCRLQYATALDLDDVSEVVERTSAHRYAITLRHAKVVALRLVPVSLMRPSRGEKETVREVGSDEARVQPARHRGGSRLREQLALRGMIPRVVSSPPRKPRGPPAYLVLRPEDQ